MQESKSMYSNHWIDYVLHDAKITCLEVEQPQIAQTQNFQETWIKKLVAQNKD